MLHKLGYEFTCETCEEPKREQDFDIFRTGDLASTCNDCCAQCQRCGSISLQSELVCDMCDCCASDMGVSK